MAASAALGSRALSGRRVHGRTVNRRSVASAPRAIAAGERLWNFSAGPAVLPMDVLEEARADLINYKGTGMSVMEMSHRGKEFMAIAADAEKDLRTLVGIPENYKVR